MAKFCFGSVLAAVDIATSMSRIDEQTPTLFAIVMLGSAGLSVVWIAHRYATALLTANLE